MVNGNSLSHNSQVGESTSQLNTLSLAQFNGAHTDPTFLELILASTKAAPLNPKTNI